MPQQVIVCTTINNVTEAIRKYDAMPGWQLVVAGDKKTPADYRLENGLYLSPDAQESLDKKLSDLIGWNCIQRRNFGLLVAHQLKAEVIAVVDDDNIPLANWGTDLLLKKPTCVNYYETSAPAFDPVGATNEHRLWHRGFPLQLLRDRDYTKKSQRTVVADIQADFWNGDPDIDAICRMEHFPECDFSDDCFPIASNAWSPFNSQNTFLSHEILPEYFLFPRIGRMDDIWAAYWLQCKGATVLYGRASVYQKRNVHDLTVDMRAEFLGYERNLELIRDLKDNGPSAIWGFLPPGSEDLYKRYQDHF